MLCGQEAWKEEEETQKEKEGEKAGWGRVRDPVSDPGECGWQSAGQWKGPQVRGPEKFSGTKKGAEWKGGRGKWPGRKRRGERQA